MEQPFIRSHIVLEPGQILIAVPIVSLNFYANNLSGNIIQFSHSNLLVTSADDSMEKQEKGRRTEKNGHYKSIKQPQDKHIMPYENFSKSDAV